MDRKDEQEETERERIKDPPIIAHKGRPRTARITGQLEGRPQGGGAGIRTQASQGNKRRKVSCGVCHEEGHNRSTCPFRVWLLNIALL